VDVKDEPPAPRGTGYARRGAAGGRAVSTGARRCVYPGYAEGTRRNHGAADVPIGNDTAGTAHARTFPSDRTYNGIVYPSRRHARRSAPAGRATARRAVAGAGGGGGSWDASTIRSREKPRRGERAGP